MKRGSVQLKRVAMKRGEKPLPFRSEKMKATYKERRPLVERLLRERPRCQFEECNDRSTEIHEVVTRARGGSILDESNCMALCHDHHAYITVNPKWAQENGYMKHSWERDADS